MLEILGLVWLCNINKKNAIARGRKPGGFIALTLVLWIGMELLGLIFGILIGIDGVAYLLIIGFAGIGGLSSYLIAKNCKTGDYVSPMDKANAGISGTSGTLNIPATINIIRDKSEVGEAIDNTLTLNGHQIAVLRNGESITVEIYRRCNTLCIVDMYASQSKPFIFNIASGEHAEIHLKSGRFEQMNVVTPSL